MNFTSLDKDLKKIRWSKDKVYTRLIKAKTQIKNFYICNQDNIDSNDLYTRKIKKQLQIDSFNSIALPMLISLIITIIFTFSYDFVFKPSIQQVNEFIIETDKIVNEARDRVVSSETSYEILRVANSIIKQTLIVYFICIAIIWLIVFIIIRCLLPTILLQLSSIYLRKSDIYLYEIEVINEILKVRESNEEVAARLSLANGKNKYVYQLVSCFPLNSDEQKPLGSDVINKES